MNELENELLDDENSGIETADADSKELEPKDAAKLPRTQAALEAIFIRQRRFAIAVEKTGKIRESSEAAGFSPDHGFKLMKMPKVREAILCLIRDRERSKVITREWIRDRIAEVGEDAAANNDRPNALRAYEQLGRSEMEGSIFSDRVESGDRSHEDYVKALSERGGEADEE